MASGVPVVQPACGAFPELVEATGGGILCKAEDPEALAMALEEALTDRAGLATMAICGNRAVRESFSNVAMARKFLKVCQRVRQEQH
jgi:glycosyltransferase involved in cell wall biosynthesis